MRAVLIVLLLLVVAFSSGMVAGPYVESTAGLTDSISSLRSATGLGNVGEMVPAASAPASSAIQGIVPPDDQVKCCPTILKKTCGPLLPACKRCCDPTEAFCAPGQKLCKEKSCCTPELDGPCIDQPICWRQDQQGASPSPDAPATPCVEGSVAACPHGN
jgi:hypothetical protein